MPAKNYLNVYENDNSSNKTSNTSIWIIALAMAIVLTASFAFGYGYSGIRKARLETVETNLKYIEIVLELSELKAETKGLTLVDGTYNNILNSYENYSGLGEYERFVIAAMLETIGANRKFDFAVHRYSNSSGNHLQIYYFPVKGRVDTKRDVYYLLEDGIFYEKNSN